MAEPAANKQSVENELLTADSEQKVDIQNTKDQGLYQDATDTKPRLVWARAPKDETMTMMVDVSLAAFQHHLICGLCRGLFCDPYTITKCLHTFCRSCLFYFAIAGQHFTCPTCDTYIGQDVRKCLALPDRTLQTLIDKIIFPGVAQQDAAAEELFYRQRGIQRKASALSSPEQNDENGGIDEEEKENGVEDEHEDDEDVFDVNDDVGADLNGEGARERPRQQEKTILFQLLPGNTAAIGLSPPALPLLDHPFLRTSSVITMGVLKQYIHQQLLVSASKSSVRTQKRTVGSGEDLPFVRNFAPSSPSSSSTSSSSSFSPEADQEESVSFINTSAAIKAMKDPLTELSIFVKRERTVSNKRSAKRRRTRKKEAGRSWQICQNNVTLSEVCALVGVQGVVDPQQRSQRQQREKGKTPSGQQCSPLVSLTLYYGLSKVPSDHDRTKSIK